MWFWNAKILGGNSGFPYANQLWKIIYLLYEMGPCLFASVKHVYTYGKKDCEYKNSEDGLSFINAQLFPAEKF
jgi:hypothetical protein